MSVLSDAQIIALWLREGGPLASAPTALAHALAESTGNTDDPSSNPDGGTNIGLYQLDARGVGSGYTPSSSPTPTPTLRSPSRPLRAARTGRSGPTTGPTTPRRRRAP